MYVGVDSCLLLITGCFLTTLDLIGFPSVSYCTCWSRITSATTSASQWVLPDNLRTSLEKLCPTTSQPCLFLCRTLSRVSPTPFLLMMFVHSEMTQFLCHSPHSSFLVCLDVKCSTISLKKNLENIFLMSFGWKDGPRSKLQDSFFCCLYFYMDPRIIRKRFLKGTDE